MPICLSIFLSALRRAVVSWRWLLCTLGVAAAQFFAVSGFLGDGSSVVYLCALSLSGSSVILLVAGVLPLLPFAMTFASDYTERADVFHILRASGYPYFICKYIVCMISGFLTTFCGMSLFACLLSIRYPLLVTVSSGDAYAVLLEAGKPLRYLLMFNMHTGLSAVLFCGAAALVAAYIPDKFTTIAAPVVIYVLLHRLTEETGLPNILKFGVLVECQRR